MRIKQTLDTEKQRNLSNKQYRTSTPLSSAPGWNETLASASEASVKVGVVAMPANLTPYSLGGSVSCRHGH